jgi:hypothetical protein
MNRTQCPACKKTQTFSRAFIRGLPGGLEADGRLKCRCGHRFFPNEHLDDAQTGHPLIPIYIEKRS